MGDTVLAGFDGQGGGMNAAVSPSRIRPDQYARGINVSVRGGLIKTRPGFVEETISPAMPTGTFQGAGTWSLQSGDRIVFVVEGTVYILIVDTMSLITVAPLLSSTNQCFMTQTDRYFIVQDGESTPVIFEDVSGVPQIVTPWTYESPDAPGVDITGPSIPIGYMSVYAHGRYHVVPKYITNTTVDGRDSIVSGDIKLPNDPRTVLEATETEYLNGGGAHSLPLELGFIGGLGVYRNAPTGTGNGEVIAFGRHGVCGFDFSPSREQSWDTIALSRVLFFGAGSKSPWSIVNVNDDLVYRGLDGLRILRYVITQTAGSSGGMSNLPASLEVNTFLENDAAYLPLVSCALADNRLYTTAGGRDSNFFRGLVCWDFAAAYYNGAPGVGAYDGVWTGDNFGKVISALRGGVPTAYVFAEGPILYRVDPAAVADYSASRGVVSIESRFETRAFNFDSPLNAKQLRYVEIGVSSLVRDTEIAVFYRANGYALWKELGSQEVLITPGSLPQRRRKLRFSLDFEQQGCDNSSNELTYVGQSFQVAVQWTGYLQLEYFQVAAEVVPEPPTDPCGETERKSLTASDATGEILDDFSYSIRS